MLQFCFIFRSVIHLELISMKGVRSVSIFTFLRMDVQVFQQRLLKRPPWLHPLPLPLCQRSADCIYRGVSHVFGAGISLFSSSRKLLYFVHGPGGNGEFLELPSGSCYGNSSAGQEASVSILPAKCPCPRWTWEWTGATAPPVPQPSL